MAMQQASFSGHRQHYRADTCAPVAAAAQAGAIGYQAVIHGAYPGLKLPGTMLPELRNAGYWDIPDPQPWGLDWHRNEGIEFTCLTTGHLEFAVEDRAFSLRPGDMTITRPWQQHRVGAPHVGASRLIWVILDVGVRRPNQSWSWPSWLVLTREECQRLSILLRQNEQPVWKADAQLLQAFNQIARVVGQSAKSFDRTRMVLAINELLQAILELLAGRNITLDASLTSSERTVELFLADLPAHADEVWTVDTMAARCGLKRSQFTTYCRQLTNLSPAQYLTRCRVEAAARLLRAQPAKSITEIAMTCGFATSQYFATTFRRLKGVAPGQFRTASCAPRKA